MTITHDMEEKLNLGRNKRRGFEKTKSNKGASLPKRGTTGSAGYDFVLQEDVTIPSGWHSKMIPLGIKAYMLEDEVLLLFIRSSLGIKKGLVLSNTVGVIDSDYYNNPDNEGEIHVQFYNTSNQPVTLKAGERVIQGVFTHYLKSDEDATDAVREGGFGSTNK